MKEKVKRKIGGFVPAEIMEETKKYSADTGIKIAAILEKALREYLTKNNLIDAEPNRETNNPA